MSFGQEIVMLFKNMPVAAIICLATGILLIIVEIFKPGFGIFGILGGALTVAGIVIRVLVRDGNIFIQILIILITDAFIAGLAIVLMYLLTRHGFLRRTPLVQFGTAVDKLRSAGTPDNRELLGKEGIALTNLHPGGKAQIDDAVYDVISDGIFIADGEAIQVTAIEGSMIKVKKPQ